MGKIDQSSGLDAPPQINEDLLGIKALGIEYNTTDLKKLSQEEIQNLQEEIQNERKNPGVDLTQRISIILQLAGIKNKFTRGDKPVGERLTGSATNAKETGTKLDTVGLSDIQKANDTIKALAPGFVEGLSKDIKLTDLTEQQKNFLATQQGTTPEKIDLTSPATQSLVEAFVIDKNKDHIKEDAIKKGKSSQEVDNIFTTWGMKMNEYQIPVNGSIDSSLKGIPKKIADPVKSTYQEIVGDKTPPAVTRTGDKLTFNDPKNEKYGYEIDISRMPPKLAKTMNGLSISRDIQQVSPDKKELQKLEGDIQKITEVLGGQKVSESMTTIAGVDLSFLDEQTKDGKSPEAQQSLEQYRDTKNNLARILKTESPTEKLQAIQEMKKANHSLDKTRRKTISPENMDNPKQGALEQSLWEEQEALTYLETLYQPLVDKGGRIKTLKEQTKNEKTDDDSFERNAEYNLNFLSYIGYDSLGQGNMERIIRVLNSSKNPKQSEIGEIDLNQKLDTTKTQALTLAITNTVRTGRKLSGGEQTPEQKKTEESQKTWDSVNKSDPFIAARQTQSFGFREALKGVASNMTQEGGNLKTNTALEKIILGNTENPKSKTP